MPNDIVFGEIVRKVLGQVFADSIHDLYSVSCGHPKVYDDLHLDQLPDQRLDRCI